MIWIDLEGAPFSTRLSPSRGWISLSNIIFAPDGMGHIALPLVNGWTAYGSDYGTPDYTVRNGMCSLEGLLYKSGSSANQQLALLPEDCRPGRLAGPEVWSCARCATGGLFLHVPTNSS